jgi:prepilin-type N-terminal cleavage/methylation domain-containing protein
LKPAALRRRFPSKGPARNEAGFTLIEIVIVIAILGILSSVALPAYRDMTLDARRNACKAALGGLREGIQNWQADRALATGVGTYPEIDSVGTPNVVMSNRVPPNPFQAENRAPDSVVQGVVKGQVYGTRGGWAYNPANGQIWPNTNSTLGGTGCGGSTSVGENNW